MSSNVEIRIRGTLPADAAERLGMTATREPADTILRGVVADQPALHGVLDRLRCNGIELIDVRRIPGADDIIVARQRADTPPPPR